MNCRAQLVLGGGRAGAGAQPAGSRSASRPAAAVASRSDASTNCLASTDEVIFAPVTKPAALAMSTEKPAPRAGGICSPSRSRIVLLYSSRVKRRRACGPARFVVSAGLTGGGGGRAAADAPGPRPGFGPAPGSLPGVLPGPPAGAGAAQGQRAQRPERRR